MKYYYENRIEILVICLTLLVIAIGYLIYGFTSKCGGFEDMLCPRGFKCDLTEDVNRIMNGELDQCEIRRQE